MAAGEMFAMWLINNRTIKAGEENKPTNQPRENLPYGSLD
jgi:hypothetical protein